MNLPGGIFAVEKSRNDLIDVKYDKFSDGTSPIESPLAMIRGNSSQGSTSNS
jgi:hypothetical protein